MAKLNLYAIFSALDRKDYHFFLKLSDDQRKELFGSLFPMIRWSSCPQGNSDIQEYCLLSTNENMNKNYFDISKHPELVWMLMCSANPGIGSYKRKYIKGISKKQTQNKAERFLQTVYPNKSNEDIQLLCKLNDKKSLIKLAQDYGYNPAEIKKLF